MALAASLIKGFQYRVNQQGGMLEGDVVTIVDNTPFPDSDIGRRRKITVRFTDGSEGYLLPRALEDRPCGVEPSVDAQAFQHGGTLLLDEVAPAPRFNVTTKEEAGPVSVPVLDTATAATIVVDKITDPMDDRLDHLRPKPSKVKRYIKREMKNGMSDVEMLLLYTSDDFRATNGMFPANLALKGDTQSGKTILVEVLAVLWAELLGLPKPMPVFTLSGSSGVTDFDLFGQMTSYADPLTGTDRLIWLPGIVELAAQCGGILYLDEINAMDARVTSSLHPLLDHRHTFTNRNKPVWSKGQFMPEVTRAHPDLWIIATYNEGYQGIGKMNEALHGRWDHIQWDYDEKVENTLVKSPDDPADRSGDAYGSQGQEAAHTVQHGCDGALAAQRQGLRSRAGHRCHARHVRRQRAGGGRVHR